MVQQLKANTDYADNLHLVLTNHTGSSQLPTAVCRTSAALFWCPWALVLSCTYPHPDTGAHAHTHRTLKDLTQKSETEILPSFGAAVSKTISFHRYLSPELRIQSQQTQLHFKPLCLQHCHSVSFYLHISDSRLFSQQCGWPFPNTGIIMSHTCLNF